MRSLSHDPRHRGRRTDRSRPDPHRDAPDAGRRNPAKHARESRCLDPRSAAGETRQSDAPESTRDRRSSGARRVPGNAPMTRRPDPPIDGRFQLLEETWSDPQGVYGWFTHVDHKSIGRRYLVTAFAFFLMGGVLAALMRLQLSRPDNSILGPDLYNQIFTTHGTTMMFLFAVPVMQGLGIYFVPLMV